MKIHDQLEQKSWDWFKARAGKVTGSEINRLITDKLALRSWKSAMPNSYLNLKLAEKWRGEALQSFAGSQQTDQGLIYEEKARSYFASLLERDIRTIGGMESDDGKCWCSPDGIITDGVGLEIKCGNADTHIGWLLDGTLPEEHLLQVHFGLFVSGFKEWKFLSWSKDLPHLAVTVTPDEAITCVIAEAVQGFNERLDAAFQKLVELNGGPPPVRKLFIPSADTSPLFAGHDPDDVIP